MSVFSKAISWAGDHPVIIGVGVFAIGGIVLLSLNKGGSGDGGMSSFYAAQAAQNASNNSVALAQVQGTTTTAVAKIASDTSIANTNTAAGVAMAQNTTLQQGQKQQFFLDVGEQQIEGQVLPYILGRPDLEGIISSFNAAGTGYNAAH